MLRINLRPNAVAIALRFSRELDLVDEKTREQVLSMMWFHYIGRAFDWWSVLWLGETWTCVCTWVNSVLRKRCHNCGKERPIAL